MFAAPEPSSSEFAATVPVFGTDVGHDVLVEELEDEWDTVGKHQVLGDNLKLQERRRRQVGIVKRFFAKETD